jgi:protein tyrosine/serine phosphatase
MKLAFVSIVLGALFLCATGCAPATVGLQKTGIANVAVVDDGPGGLYRGAQPSRDGIKTLHDELHVKTVIDLRDDAEPWEADAVKTAGMTYNRIPTDAAVVDPEKIREFLKTLRSAARPVYVHCRQGRDRTGLELAIYRIVDLGWTRERAIDELYAHGFNHFWFPNIDHYLRTFDPNQFKLPTQQPIHASTEN